MSKTLAIGHNNRNTAAAGDDAMCHDNCPHIPNAETLAALKEAEEHLRQLEAGEIQPRFNNIAEFFNSLDELFEGYMGEPKCCEYDFGEDVGREVL